MGTNRIDSKIGDSSRSEKHTSDALDSLLHKGKDSLQVEDELVKPQTKIPFLSKIIARFNAGSYSFLSGVCVAEFMNLFTTVFASDQLPRRWIALLLSSALALVSACFWIALYLGLEPLQKIAINEVAKLGISVEEFIASQSHTRRLVAYFIIAALSGIAGLMVLLIR